ncbi:hypothetical protein ACX6VJ_001448 [Klebsiella variicola]|uniref:hypothetical protein n=1 Tax=Klebsiella variicola TaxID=244366 RepID=UPI0009E546CA|nr:hypothetical protein [Klebsiella variicola]
MRKLPLVLIILTLSGCVDLGRVGMHPDLKTAYFNGHQNAVENCLYDAALNQKLSLMKDDPLPGGTKRYNLQDANYEDVAWVEVSKSGDQTSVDFYYAPDVRSSIFAMIDQCQKSLH